jgi:hypothetical protein
MELISNKLSCYIDNVILEIKLRNIFIDSDEFQTNRYGAMGKAGA